MQSRPVLSRRNAMSTAGAGLALLASTRGVAAGWTPAERANVRVDRALWRTRP